jgi:beta-glucanase (GH16 family)
MPAPLQHTTLHCSLTITPTRYTGGRDFGTVEAAADWHNYKLRWDVNEITMWVDNLLAFHATSAQWRTGTKRKASDLEAPFDQPFYFIFNIAVGGNWPGSEGAGSVPDDSVMQLLVDYIRVYEGE